MPSLVLRFMHAQIRSCSDPLRLRLTRTRSLLLGLTHAETLCIPCHPLSDPLMLRLSHTQTHSYSDKTMFTRSCSVLRRRVFTYSQTQSYPVSRTQAHSYPVVHTQTHSRADSFILRHSYAYGAPSMRGLTHAQVQSHSHCLLLSHSYCTQKQSRPVSLIRTHSYPDPFTFIRRTLTQTQLHSDPLMARRAYIQSHARTHT